MLPARPIQNALASLLIGAIALNPLAVSIAWANDPTPMGFTESVRNTKETESILLRAEDRTRSDIYYPSSDPSVQSRLKIAFNAFAKSMEASPENPPPAVCEPRILSRIQTEIAKQHLPNDSDALRYALLLFREWNLIDDLTLMPLLAAYPVWEKLGFSEKDWTRKDSEGRVAQVDCPTEQYLHIVSSVKQSKGRKMKRRHIRESIETAAAELNDRKEPRFLTVQIEWFRTLARTRYDRKTEFALAAVLQEVAVTKSSSPRADRYEKPSRIMSKRKKKSGGLSNRLALYAKYSGFQIGMLADVLKTFTERSNIVNAKAEIVIHYADGRPDEIYALNPQEQYRMATKMLHKQIEELKNSQNFAGRAPTFDEVILAGLETGFIHASELDVMLGIDDLWNPKVTGWQKFSTILRKYGTTALIMIPNPYTFWASLAIILVETFITQKTQGAGKADDRGISIF